MSIDYAQLPWLNETDTQFPNHSEALSNGLIAAGGKLSSERILSAYRQGIFPWFNSDSPTLWWSPDPRMVLTPEQVKVSKSLKRNLKKQQYDVTVNKAFSAVISACSKPRVGQYQDGSSGWIHPDMINAYTKLHELGHAHSIECWEEDRLVGGLYGVAIGQVFFGESMFSIAPDSSKIALVTLCQQLQKWKVKLIDCQVYSDHLASMGALEIDRSIFIDTLNQLCPINPVENSWQKIDN
jgi:leucyl/phenylalanyl-tRNA--protein transferase|tara:strand:+ start:375 stop:1091 length:717 start_codon:yes stop_codon:yes gene_type:complete